MKKITLKKSSFIIKNKEIKENYIFEGEICHGSTSIIRKVIHKITQEERVVKIMQSKRISNKLLFYEEIDKIKELDHPNIIKLYEWYEDDKNIYFVTEICKGGELLMKLEKFGNLSEEIAKKYFIQMISSVNCVHSQNIILKNLKPEKFLFDSLDINSSIKLLNLSFPSFFQSTSLGNVTRLKSLFSTDYFEAPEISKGYINKSCDIWSCGVILYVLLCGSLPFDGLNSNQLYELMMQGKIKFQDPDFDKLSNDAKELLYKMINHPDKRPNGAQILEDKWLKSKGESPFKSNNEINALVKNIKAYRFSMRFQKAIITYLVTQCNEAEIQDLKNIFYKMDKNHDGYLTFEDISIALEKIMTKEEINCYMESIDLNKNDKIDYTEFLASCISSNIILKDEKLISCFNIFDKDKNGKISLKEIQSIIGTDFDAKEEKIISDLLNEFDLDSDGQIDINEFMKMMFNLKDLQLHLKKSEL